MWQNSNATPRIQRWGLRLQPCQLVISYQPGNFNPSDYLSRHPEPNDQTRSKTSLQERVTKQHVTLRAITYTPRLMS